ncbi:MAG: TetR family transcriptional regulator [Eubacterium sp.]
MVTLNSRTELIKSAKKLFFSNGYEDTTTRMIANDCDINSGLISYYFKNKKNLAKLVLIDHFEEIVSQIISLCGNLDSLVIFLLFQRLNQFYFERDKIFNDFILETMNLNIMEEACLECSYFELVMNIVKDYHYQRAFDLQTASILFLCYTQDAHSRIFFHIKKKTLRLTYKQYYELFTERIFELLAIPQNEQITLLDTIEVNMTNLIEKYYS